MANLNLNFDALTKLKDWWGVVKSNFTAVNDQVEDHVDGISDKHAAEDITFNSTRPTITADDVLEAIEEVDQRVDGIVNNPDPNKDLELVDFRTSSVYGAFATAKERGDNADAILDKLTVKMSEYATGTGVDEFTEVQAAVTAAEGKILYWGKQIGAEYLLSDRITIPSNTTIIFEPGTIVRSITPSQAFDIREVDNVNILGNGALIKMDKSQYTVGEFNHTISIRAAHGIRIENLNIFENGGDGFYIGGQSTDARECKDIIIKGCKIDGSKRNNISITYAENVTIESCLLLNASGTNPQYGIDVEPNADTFARYINIVNCHAEGNANAGFGLAFGAERCTIRGCSAKNTGLGFTLGGGAGSENRYNTLSDCISENNTSIGFYIRYSPDTQIQNCRSLNNNSFGLQISESDNTIASNNIIEGNGNRGIVIASDNVRFVNNRVVNNEEGGIVATAGANVIISGNYCEGNYGATYDANIYVGCANSIITDNTCRKGANVDKPARGILSTAGATNCLIVNNDLYNSGETESLNIGSSTTINKGNINLTGEFSSNLFDEPEIKTYTYDPASIAAGSGVTSPQIPFNGARIGDFVVVAAPYNLQGLQVTGYVDASNSVVIRIDNNTAGAIDLGSGNWKIKLMKN